VCFSHIYIKDFEMGLLTKLIPLCTIVMFTLSAFPAEQDIPEDQVPDAVLESFSKSFPHAITQNYGTVARNDTTFYEIEATEEKTSSAILYDSNGTIVESVVKIPSDSLPSSIKDFLHSTYKKISFMIAKRTFKNHKITYSVLLDANNSIEVKYFDTDGSLAKDPDETF
jgi:hypothetical protein